ncbi:hypothetical protein BH11BAC4_BH11BAC4_12800 [soil metagenome]
MVIRSKTLRWLIILSTVIVAIIIAVQLFWLTRVYRLERRQFNTNVTKTIKNLFRNNNLIQDSTFTFNKNIELPVAEIYLARVDRLPSVDSISNFISKELTDYNLLSDCTISIYDGAQKKYISSRLIDMPNSYPGSIESLNAPVFQRPYSYISVYFPHRQLYIVTQMMFWIISSGTLLLVLIGFGFSLFYLYRQRFLNEIQKDFVNNFTHEFKTPLSVIKIATGVLQEPAIIEKPERLVNYANIIQAQANHLQSQLNRMLVIAYTEHSKLRVQKDKFDANLLVKQAVDNIYPLIEEKSGNLSIILKSSNTIINADNSYLLLAYTNLLENAVKYSIKPGIVVTTYIEGNDFCTDIMDNGIGIEKNQQRKIYNKFYRITDGDIQQAKGFGLGLNFVKKIIDAHRGTISVKSTLGKGSTFTIKIPRN